MTEREKKMLNGCCKWWNERMKNVKMNVQIINVIGNAEMYVENVKFGKIINKCWKC